MKKFSIPRNLLRVGILFLLVGILSGCSGTLYTVEMENGKEKKIEGVRFYPLKLFLEVYQNTAYIVKGELLADIHNTPGRKCVPQLVQKLVIRPDYSNPHRIYYDHGFLENNKFGVTLKEGALVSVNTESQPDRGATVKNLGEAATKFAQPKDLGMDMAPLLACNATPVLIDISEPPKKTLPGGSAP